MILCLKGGHTYATMDVEVAKNLTAAGKKNVTIITDSQKAEAMRLLAQGYADATLVYEATDVDARIPTLGNQVPVKEMVDTKDYVIFLPLSGG